MARSLGVLFFAVLLSSLGCATLPKAAHDGDLATVNEYLLNGGSANARFEDSGGCTLLHPAADGGQVAVVQALLDRGADPNALGPYGYTPLHMAAVGQWSAVARLLLARGAAPSLTMRDAWGDTPLLLAVASVQQRDQRVYTLHGAVATSQREAEPSAEVIDILLDAGADVNVRTAKGNTPLHVAAYKGYAGTVQLLLARGASRTARNMQGQTPEDLAGLYHQEGIVAILRTP
jgi:ankyrin repeat protein